MRYLHSTPPFAILPDSRDARIRPPPAPLLAAAVHAQSEGLVIMGRRWTRSGLKIIFANESFCATTGFTEAELRKRGHGFLHSEKNNLARLKRWVSKLTAGELFNGEGYLTRKDGAQLYAAWNYSPVSDEHGNVTHIVATYRDLTEKRKLQEALIHSQRLDAVGRLAGGVAHDFNNLLSVINGYCEIMGAKNSVRRQASHELEEIHQASQKAATLVRQLLAFSRRQAMNPKVISLNQLVHDNIEILGRLLKPKKSLEFHLDAEHMNVRVDPAQLQQVLLNLTINARDALADGGKVTITTALRDVTPDMERRPPEMTPGRYVLLSVSDNGIGMDESTRAHLFEPFFTTKEHGKGTGLGLALVYGVVQQSGGFIFVHSEPGKGSTFEIFLPEIREPAQTSGTALPSLPSTRGRETIMVVEEDDVVRKMVAGILTTDGYHVLAEASAEEAIHAVRRGQAKIDLLIAQIGAAPGSEGERLVRSLADLHPGVRVLATCNPECAPLTFLPSESHACLAKPFTLSALMKATRALLDNSSIRESLPPHGPT
ncbi:MAG TPA: ATP-binding protein [Opitutaceae bacterium]|nr:ATP-binding protein [Opitutaceae bacterium]